MITIRPRVSRAGHASWLAFFAALGLFASPASSNEVRAAATLEFSRFQGKWIEVAAIPQLFSRRCVRDTALEYAKLDNNEIRLEIFCSREDAGRDRSELRARWPEMNTSAKLATTSIKLFGEYHFWISSDHWILEIDPAYQWAVIGEPSRRSGRVLSRGAALAPAMLAEIIGRLKAQGYDPCDFIVTPQTGGLTIKRPLCNAIP